MPLDARAGAGLSSSQQETLIDVIDRLAAGEKVSMAVIADAFAGVASKALNG